MENLLLVISIANKSLPNNTSEVCGNLVFISSHVMWGRKVGLLLMNKMQTF